MLAKFDNFTKVPGGNLYEPSCTTVHNVPFVVIPLLATFAVDNVPTLIEEVALIIPLETNAPVREYVHP